MLRLTSFFVSGLLVSLSNASAQEWRVREPKVDGRSMTEWIERLQCHNVEYRREAVAALAQCSQHSKKPVPYLVTALSDADAEIRLAALNGRLPDSEDIHKIIRRMIDDADESIRQTAALKAGVKLTQGVIILVSGSENANLDFVDLRLRDASRANIDGRVFMPFYFEVWEKEPEGAPSRVEDLIVKERAVAIPFALRATGHADPRVRLRALSLCRTLAVSDLDMAYALRWTLEDRDDDVRIHSLELAGSMKAELPFMLPAFTKGMRDSNPAIRQAALEGLRKLSPRSDKSVAQLFELTTEHDGDVRAAAVVALGRSAEHDDSVLRRLLPMLADPCPAVRREFCWAIGEHAASDRSLREALLTGLNDEDAEVSLAAVGSIRSICNGEDRDLEFAIIRALRCEHANSEFARAAAGCLWILNSDGTRVVPHIVEWIYMHADDDIADVVQSLTEFGDIGVRAIRTLAASGNSSIACAAIRCFDLKDLRPDQESRVANERLLEAALESGDNFRRLEALTCIGRLESVSSRQLMKLIAECIIDDDERIRIMAAESLSSAEPLPIVIRAATLGLLDRHPDVQLKCFHWLSAVKTLPASTAEVLAGVAESNDALGISALGLLAERGLAAQKIRPIVIRKIEQFDCCDNLSPVLIAAVKYPEHYGAFALAIEKRMRAEIEYVGDSGDCAAMIGILGQMGPSAKSAVSVLMDCACDFHDDVRAEAVQALGRIGPSAKAAVPLLRARLVDDNADVRLKANAALALVHPN